MTIDEFLDLKPTEIVSDSSGQKYLVISSDGVSVYALQVSILNKEQADSFKIDPSTKI